MRFPRKIRKGTEGQGGLRYLFWTVENEVVCWIFLNADLGVFTVFIETHGILLSRTDHSECTLVHFYILLYKAFTISVGATF